MIILATLIASLVLTLLIGIIRNQMYKTKVYRALNETLILKLEKAESEIEMLKAGIKTQSVVAQATEAESVVHKKGKKRGKTERIETTLDVESFKQESQDVISESLLNAVRNQRSAS